MNAIERMREISCPCWQKDHPSGGFYEAVELTPGLTVYKSTLAENTLSLLVSVSPGSGLWAPSASKRFYCRQSYVCV